MENANTLLWEVGFGTFLLVTVILAGGAAFMTGRAAAKTWLAYPQLVIYIVLLSGAARFIHFSLFGGSLLSVQYYIADLVTLLAIAFIGFFLTRAKQMRTQYGFRFEASGPFGWKPRDADRHGSATR